MATTQKTVDEILLKKPFRRAAPNIAWHPASTMGESAPVMLPRQLWAQVDQSQFLTEYDPAGHKINDQFYYADRVKSDSTGQRYIHFVERVSLPMQQIIVTKQMAHLSGNYIQFVDSNPLPTEEQKNSLIEFKQGWINKNMEVAMHEFFEMEKITGDSALCGYIHEGEFGWRTFGYKNGEILYPHYDNITGKLNLFARRYMQNEVEYVDVWDSKNMTTYTRQKGWMAKVSKVIGADGWNVEARAPHGFDFVPISYKRDDMGACWSNIQDCIDKFELAVSQLLENNKSYAFRIMFIKGDGDIQKDADGMPSVIIGDENSDAKFLEKADASTSFELQLKILEKYILMGSFTVLPPEISGSGDVSGVTIKLLYSPAVEKAMEDSQHWNQALDDVVSIFKFGFGVETKKSAQFNNLPVRGEIIPYVHQNLMEQATILSTGVTMGTLSVETASPQYPNAANDEFARITKQNEAKLAQENAKIEATAKAKQTGMNQNNKARENAGI